MRTLPRGDQNIKAFYAHLYEQSGVLTKVQGTIFFFGDDGAIVEYEPEMATFCTVLGECAVADTQKIMDRIHGGAAWICTHRAQEVA